MKKLSKKDQELKDEYYALREAEDKALQAFLKAKRAVERREKELEEAQHRCHMASYKLDDAGISYC